MGWLILGIPSGRAQAPPPLAPPQLPAVPVIEVYSMGPGDYLFSRMGHTAICILDDQAPAGRCYNYGTTDFGNPLLLTWQVIRGRSRFWAETTDLPRMLTNYMHENRTIFRQRLQLTPDAAQRVAVALRKHDRVQDSLYTYNHIRDNCTTRVRDLLDQATSGVLRRRNEEVSRGGLRQALYTGLAGDPLLLLAQELVGARPIDGLASRYDGLYFPAHLRLALESAFAAPSETVYLRQGAALTGSPSGGKALLLGLGLVLCLLAIGMHRHGGTRWPLIVALVPLGLLACFVYVLALCSPMPELRFNEVLLVLCPLDIGLPWLPPAWRVRWLPLRLAGVALCAIASLVGWLHQPIGAIIGCTALLLVLSLYLATRRNP